MPSPVYDEWQNSKFSQRNPLTFYTAGFETCQDCHMKRSRITLNDDGAKHNTLASHRWPAGNTAVPFFYGFRRAATEKDGGVFKGAGNYLNVDLFGIKKAGGEMVAPLGSSPFHLAPKETVQMMVVIQNKDIGHSLVLPKFATSMSHAVEFVGTGCGGRGDLSQRLPEA